MPPTVHMEPPPPAKFVEAGARAFESRFAASGPTPPNYPIHPDLVLDLDTAASPVERGLWAFRYIQQETQGLAYSRAARSAMVTELTAALEVLGPRLVHLRALDADIAAGRAFFVHLAAYVLGADLTETARTLDDLLLGQWCAWATGLGYVPVRNSITHTADVDGELIRTVHLEIAGPATQLMGLLGLVPLRFDTDPVIIIRYAPPPPPTLTLGLQILTTLLFRTACTPPPPPPL